jgi:hypothetical protein
LYQLFGSANKWYELILRFVKFGVSDFITEQTMENKSVHFIGGTVRQGHKKLAAIFRYIKNYIGGSQAPVHEAIFNSSLSHRIYIPLST